MNKTKIDWADYSWNPVTGCLHGCKYCYARRIAKRFGEHKKAEGVVELHWKRDNPYPYDFYPTFHKYRLGEPQKVKKPQTIFVCSMADLFGNWVPNEWIRLVFEACEKAPHHRYLFLTKNPKRYVNMTNNASNFWYGATATNEYSLSLALNSFMQQRVNAEKYFNTFISIEPILEEIKIIENDGYFSTLDWVIIGAETGNRKDKIIPKKEWIENIVESCKKANIPVFMKESIKELMGDKFVQEYPW